MEDIKWNFWLILSILPWLSYVILWVVIGSVAIISGVMGTIITTIIFILNKINFHK
jgi:hypothetical protein